MKKSVWLAVMAVLFIGLANPVCAGMQSANFKIPTSHFSGGGAFTGSANFKMQSSAGQSSPLMDADDPPWSSSYDLYPGYWYTLNAGLADCGLAAFAAAFGSLSGDANYSPVCDFDEDGDVDGEDFFVLIINY